MKQLHRNLLLSLALATYLFMEYFCRCPERTPDSDHGLLSPCDGIIIGMEGQTILVQLSIFDVHCQRAPCDGIVVESSEINTISIQDSSGDISIVTLRQGAIGRSFRIEIKVKLGQEVTRGQKISQIWLGSNVRFTVPEGYTFTKHMGDIVYTGESIIAIKGGE